MKAIIFDMDGVVVDTMHLHFKSWQEMLGNRGIRISEKEFHDEYAGMSSLGTVEKMFPEKNSEAYAEMVKEKRNIFHQMISSGLEPVKGLKNFLRDLTSNGYKTGLATSSSRDEMNLKIEQAGLAEYFNVMIDSTKCENAKPDPEIYLLTAKELGVKPAECVVFEDALMGIQAAESAGMKVVVVLTTLEKEEISNYESIRDFTEVSVEDLEKLFQ